MKFHNSFFGGTNMHNIALDAIDIRLLNALQADASLTNLELAAQVHVSPPTCLRRVKRFH
jgi:Lrp/AsnC family transcriptional regulator, leucine-responsive regulatory protein